MDIYVVQPGDNINTIANKYGVTTAKLIQDNGLENPNNLVPGQTIVIAYPKQTYIVQEGDTLKGIADSTGISLMQLLRNNPYLCIRDCIYPGETLVISYNTIGKMVINGFTYPYINKDNLLKALPNLTYLSIFNYRSLADGGIIAYYDDTEVIQLSKAYGVIPLMMTTTLTPQGIPNSEAAMTILQSEEIQDIYINNLLNILKAKGYSGANIIFNFINVANQKLYEVFLSRVSKSLSKEGYLLIATFNYSIVNVNHEISFEHINFSTMNQSVNAMIFLQLTWGTNNGPPSPVMSVNDMKKYIDYLITLIPPDKIILGTSLISYDWALPYIAGSSTAHALTLNSAIRLAYDTSSIIQFDEISQTPYFQYNESDSVVPIQHIVWSIDARSIDAINKLITENGLLGVGLWNIMVYYPQIWLIFYSQFEIQKFIPDSLS